MPEDTQYLSCHTVCYAETFNYKYLSELLLNDMRGSCYRDVIYLDKENGHCAVLPFGVVVYWNMRNDVIERIEDKINQCMVGTVYKDCVEHYSYIVTGQKNRFYHDHIELEDDEPLTLLAISHALAQSVKLSVFEDQAQRTIETTSTIPKTLAETGSTSLSRPQIAKMRGQLFLTKSDIILKYELLDTPEFFWEYPELEPIYQVGANYLELKPRTEILSLKLATIHELLEILADELKHKHSSKLEWIIIWLIAVEIIIFVVNELLLV